MRGLLTAAFALTGCLAIPPAPVEPDDDGGALFAQLTVLTNGLPDAIAGAEYSQQLAVRGGAPPYTFELGAGPAWMKVHPVTGRIYGRPESAHATALARLTARDTLAAASTVELTVRTADCQPGVRYPCSSASGSECWLGTRLCEAAGTFGACEAVRLSDDESRCGLACGVCGAGALECLDGRCGCGDVPGATCVGADACCLSEAGSGCVSLLDDPLNCGQCGAACTVDPGLRRCGVCSGGSCSPPVCCGGYGDCDGDNGQCETELGSTTAHCGACGNDCEAKPQVATAKCEGAVCAVIGCDPGFLDCDGVGDNGCEVNPVDNDTGEFCGAANEALCTDANRSCSARLAGKHVKADGWRCVNTACQVKPGGCEPGWYDCDDDGLNGCEQQADVANCSACRDNCTEGNRDANATVSCNPTTFTCQIDSCVAPWRNCDGSASNGCETNTNTNLSHCGLCNNACGAGIACRSGDCCQVCTTGCGGSTTTCCVVDVMVCTPSCTCTIQ